MEDYYQILGVDRSATREDIRKAYRRLAHKHHPDKGGDEKQFKKVSEAYRVLSDQEKRAQYDRYGSAFDTGQQSGGGYGSPFGFNFQQSDFEDLFGDFDWGDLFGFGFRQDSRRKKTARGEDVYIALELDLAEILESQNKKIALEKYVACRRCQGEGAEPQSSLKECSACRGKGRVHQVKRTILGSVTQYTSCPECQGTGKIPEKPCNVCRGQGRMKEESEIDLTIPAGVDHGQMLKFDRQGHAGLRGQAPGDLYVETIVKPDDRFQRQGDDLIGVLPISFSQAVLGGEAKMKVLSGREIEINIPQGTESGQVIKVRNEGIPRFGRFGRGDLHLRLQINTPKKLTEEQEKLLKDLQKQGL